VAESDTTARNESWLTLLRREGRGDLGGGLRRLAQLAAAAHRQQVAEQAMDDPEQAGASHGALPRHEAEGVASGAIDARAAGQSASGDGKEPSP
jgi:hypothetical protein